MIVGALKKSIAFGLFITLTAGCRGEGAPHTEPGVSYALAQHRAALLTDIRYALHLTVPDSVDQPIRGRVVLRFQLGDAGESLVVDFAEPRESVLSVRANLEITDFDVINDHIVIPAQALVVGENSVEIEFLAGDASLNRNREFLYTLFVPDRARFAIPCFDQPNLKARFELTLDVPADWRAVANGRLLSSETDGERAVHAFAETKPISTYLFSFVAGEFDIVRRESGGRVMQMYHRETDSLKVARNTDAIFQLHEAALDWLEEYTGIGYPFEKFDFVAIPSFQYGGMEHPGAILYRASRLLLDESATQNDMLGRAGLIAHETAHMWFGDLVTMEWFDDVWMKEVFASFMAAKIVNPSFPDLNHELRFLLAHYPTAYEVDRTSGANPIRQELDNLREAGTLYGAIIYQKAPIVMKHLEELLGEGVLRDGLREYLQLGRGTATADCLHDSEPPRGRQCRRPEARTVRPCRGGPPLDPTTRRPAGLRRFCSPHAGKAGPRVAHLGGSGRPAVPRLHPAERPGCGLWTLRARHRQSRVPAAECAIASRCSDPRDRLAVALGGDAGGASTADSDRRPGDHCPA
jgi:aminopeptidase N